MRGPLDASTWALLATLCLAMIAWLQYDVNTSLEIDYDLAGYLVNVTTNERMRPVDVIRLESIVRPTEEYFAKTTALQRLYHLASQTNYLNPFAAGHVYSDPRQLARSGWPVASLPRCGREMSWIQGELAAHRHHALLEGRLGEELTQLVDSFGKPAAGFLSGVITWPGQYDQCKRLTLNGGQIKMRYCLAQMRPRAWPERESGLPKTRIQVGVCLPESCDTLAFATQRDKIHSLVALGLDEFLRGQLVLDSLFCLPDERSPVRQLSLGAKIFLAATGLWLAAIALASYRVHSDAGCQSKCVHEPASTTCNGGHGAARASNNMAPPSPVEPAGCSLGVAGALAIQRSWASLTAASPQADDRQRVGATAEIETQTRQVFLAPINSVKCLMAVLVIVCHSYFFVNVNATSLARRVDLSLCYAFYAGSGLNKVVDTFFVFFGLFAAYNILRHYRTETLANPLTWLQINGKMLARHLPLYLVLYCFAKNLEVHLGEGPWWDYGVYRYSARGNCIQEPWWRAIPYFGNLGAQPRTSCVPSGWFLTCLCQTSLLLPLVIFLLHKLPGHLTKHLLLAFLALVSAVQIVIKMRRQSSIRDEAFGKHGAFLILSFELWQSTGTMASLGRLSGIAYGCYLGYLLRAYETGAIREWPRWLTSRRTLFWALFGHLVVLSIPVAGKIFIDLTGHTTSINEFLGSYIVTLVAWPVLNGVLILNSATVYSRARLCRALGHPFWHSANKLGPCLYLIHWSVLSYLISSYQGAPSAGHITDALKLASLGLVISLFLSFLIVLLFDVPFTALRTIILGKLETATADIKRKQQPRPKLS